MYDRMCMTRTTRDCKEKEWDEGGEGVKGVGEGVKGDEGVGTRVC